MVMSPVHQVWPKPSCKAQWKEEDEEDRERGGTTTPGTGQAWSSPSSRGQWRTGKKKWKKLVVKSSVVPQRPSRSRDRWWWWPFSVTLIVFQLENFMFSSDYVETLCDCWSSPRREAGDVWRLPPPASGISGLSFDSTLLSPLLFFNWVLFSALI